MSKRVDLGVELAGFTDFDHHGTPQRRLVTNASYSRDAGWAWVKGDTPDAGAPPPLIDRCAQCQRYLPGIDTVTAAIRAYEQGERLCDECADMRNR